MVENINNKNLQIVEQYILTCEGVFDGQFDLDFDKKLLSKEFWNKIRDLIHQKDFIGLVNINNGEINGVILSNLLEWDTNHFSLNTHRILFFHANNFSAAEAILTKYLEIVSSNKCEYITCRIPLANELIINTLHKYNFVFLLSKVLMRYNILNDTGSNSSNEEELKIRQFAASDEEVIKRIAMDSMEINRFYKDEIFRKDLIRSLYSKWLEKNIIDNPQTILIAEVENKVAGFITCTELIPISREEGNQDYKIGFIDLVGVDKKYKGTGKHLLKAAKKFFISNNFKVIYANTALQNIRSMMMFQKEGFHVYSAVSEFSLHLKQFYNVHS